MRTEQCAHHIGLAGSFVFKFFIQETPAKRYIAENPDPSWIQDLAGLSYFKTG